MHYKLMKSHLNLVCERCGFAYPINAIKYTCEKCGGLVEYVYDDEYLKSINFVDNFSFWRYKSILPPVQKIISLGEGGTPLQKSQRLAESIGIKDLLLKNETRNPTSSFKDRSASLIVSDVLTKGFSSLICATNGNHGASIAAYSAKANIDCHLIVSKNMDLGKLTQMIVYNAFITESGSSVKNTIERAITLEKERGWYQATTELNPLSIEGLKTISFEIFEQGVTPDWLVVAMGSGVTIYSLWKGYKELMVMNLVDEPPKLIGVQAEGCSPIAQAFNQGLDDPIKLDKTETDALAIDVAEPIYGELALRAIKESGGYAISVTDDEMHSTGREIAKFEGIFPEPASASTVACLNKLLNQKTIDAKEQVVCLITSSGLKTDDILQSLKKRMKTPGLGSKLTTKEEILRNLSHGRTYGYELWKKLEKEMTIGAVYQHLADLERKGLIISIIDGKRRYIELTEKGQRVLYALDELKILL
jgi:threonine synthase